MSGVEFFGRLALLGGLLALGAAWDVRRRGSAATRPRDYGLLVLIGLLGGLFGACFDQVSVTVSPEYFALGKGLEPVAGSLRVAAAGLGFQAGFVGGLAVGGVLLVTNAERPGLPRVAPRRLLALLGWPAAAALGGAALGGLALGPLDPLGLDQELRGLLAAAGRRAAFATVWGAHAGLYAGALAGTAIAVVRLRRARWAADRAAEESGPGEGPGAG